MELRKRVGAKVELAIENLGKIGVLGPEREEMDYGLNEARFASPDGKGFITSFYVSLFVPTNVLIGDRVTRDALLVDPYLDQEHINNLVLDLYKLIQAEKAEAQKELPPGHRPTAVPGKARSPGGLYLPNG